MVVQEVVQRRGDDGDEEHSGRPSEVNNNQPRATIKADPCAGLGSTYTKIGTIQRWAWPLRKDDTQIHEAFHIKKKKANLITTEVAKELNIKHSMVIWHLKQIGQVKKLDKRVPQNRKRKKIVILRCRHLLFYETTNHCLIGLWCVMKSGFYRTTGHIHLTSRQPTTTSSSNSATFCRGNAFSTSRRQKMLSKSSSNLEAWILTLQE